MSRLSGGQGSVGTLPSDLLVKTNTKDQYTWITFANHKFIFIESPSQFMFSSSLKKYFQGRKMIKKGTTAKTTEMAGMMFG